MKIMMEHESKLISGGWYWKCKHSGHSANWLGSIYVSSYVLTQSSADIQRADHTRRHPGHTNTKISKSAAGW